MPVCSDHDQEALVHPGCDITLSRDVGIQDYEYRDRANSFGSPLFRKRVETDSEHYVPARVSREGSSE